MRSWMNSSMVIRVSLKNLDKRSPVIIRARITEFDEASDCVILRTEVGDEIRLGLPEARIENVVTKDGLLAAGLSASEYPESLRIFGDLFTCDLFSTLE